MAYVEQGCSSASETAQCDVPDDAEAQAPNAFVVTNELRGKDFPDVPTCERCWLLL